MPLQNYSQQTQIYGGQLIFKPTVSYANTVTIPLYIKSIDLPVRKPKITEIATIPTYDEAGVSDWTCNAIFYGGQSLLITTMQGFFLTPLTQVTDSLGQKYSQMNPVNDNSLMGYSYGDVIWSYIQGKLNQPSNSIFVRTDPSTFIDPFGNVYNNPIIQQFQCDYSGWSGLQTFSMTLYLEV